MNMRISNIFFNKVKMTLGRVIPNASPKTVGDALLKQNLTPIIGRRNASYDVALKLSKIDIFSCSLIQQAMICSEMSDRIDSAIEDTEEITHMLSSPDTLKRERNYLTLLEGIKTLLNVWQHIMIAREKWSDNGAILSFYKQDTLEVIKRDEQAIDNLSIALINCLKHTFNDSYDKVSRYQKYMTGNFSKSFLERYNKSYNSYVELYTEIVKHENIELPK